MAAGALLFFKGGMLDGQSRLVFRFRMTGIANGTAIRHSEQRFLVRRVRIVAGGAGPF